MAYTQYKIIERVYRCVIAGLPTQQIVDELTNDLKNGLPKEAMDALTLTTLLHHSKGRILVELNNTCLKFTTTQHGKRIYDPVDIEKFYLEWILNIPITMIGEFVEERKWLSSKQTRRLFNCCMIKNVFGRKCAPIEKIIELFGKLIYEEKIRHWFTVKDVVRASGLTKYQVHEWIRRGWIKAEMSKWTYFIAPGEFDDVVSRKTLKELAVLLDIPLSAVTMAKEKKRIKAESLCLNGKVARIVVPGNEVIRITKAKDEIFRIVRNRQLRRELNSEANSYPYNLNVLNKYSGKKFSELEVPQQKNLIMAAKKGENTAREILMEQLYQKISIQANILSKKFRVKRSDCINYGRIGVLEAIEKYPDFKVDFVGYANVYIHWSIFNNIINDFSEII